MNDTGSLVIGIVLIVAGLVDLFASYRVSRWASPDRRLLVIGLMVLVGLLAIGFGVSYVAASAPLHE